MFWTSILSSPFLLSTAACISADFQQLHSQVELMTLFSCNRIWEICQISGYEKERVNGVSWSRIGSPKSSKYSAPTKYFSWQEWSLQGENEEIRGWLMLLVLPPAALLQWVSAGGFWEAGGEWHTQSALQAHSLCECWAERWPQRMQQHYLWKVSSMSKCLSEVLELLAGNWFRAIRLRCFSGAQPLT